MSFTYTATGRRQTMTDASGSTTYTYDPVTDRLVSKQTPFGTIGYTWDAAGGVKSIVSSNARGASMTYDYDVLNRLAQVTVPEQSPTVYGYDEVGNLAGYTLPNGVATAYTYDNLNRLTAMSSSAAVPGGGALSSYTYTLGAAGNRTGVTELSGRTLAYGYDRLYRLTSETISSTAGGTFVCGTTQCGTVGYTYDPVGNRRQITSTLNAIPASGLLNYDANDRTSTDAYDDAGNTVSSGGIENVYDFENHLIRHGEVRITYDGDGNRVSENVGGTVTNYLVDTENPTGYAQVIDELQDGAVTRAYTYGLFRIDQTQQIEGVWTTHFYGYDGHGSVRQLLSPTGVVTDTYDYDAFGNLINSSGTTPNIYLYAGEAYDSTLGLYYNRARYLDVRAGRFWGMDTYEGSHRDPQALHRYIYTEADPVNQVDPSGNFGLIDITLALAITVVLFSTACTPQTKLVNARWLVYTEQENGVEIAVQGFTKDRVPLYPKYKWVQQVTTNAILPGDAEYGAQPDVPYYDPPGGDDYYYTDKAQEMNNQEYCSRGNCDLFFYDAPRRNPKNYPTIPNIYWHAVLYLVGVKEGNSYDKIVQINYGFEVSKYGGTKVNPISIGRAQ